MLQRSLKLSKDQNKSIKKRVWTSVIYPDSLPAEWVDLLKKSGLKSAVSPLHNNDYNPDGEPKKAHYHLILIYGSPTTFNNVAKFTQGILCGTIPQALESVEGMYRYFTHKDNPEKAQYDEKDIQSFNGFNIYDFVQIRNSEIIRIKQELLDIIIDDKITEYCELIDIVKSMDDYSYFDVASSNTIFFTKYIASRRHSKLTPGGKMLADFREKNNENE